MYVVHNGQPLDETTLLFGSEDCTARGQVAAWERDKDNKPDAKRLTRKEAHSNLDSLYPLKG
jgi:hypothetical protein